MRSERSETTVATATETTTELSENAQRAIGRAQRRRQIRYQMFVNGERCAYCRRTFREFKQTTLDHIRAKSKGGDDNPRNLVLCCYRCNQFKAAATAVELLRWALRVLWVSAVRQLSPKGGVA